MVVPLTGRGHNVANRGRRVGVGLRKKFSGPSSFIRGNGRGGKTEPLFSGYFVIITSPSKKIKVCSTLFVLGKLKTF